MGAAGLTDPTDVTTTTITMTGPIGYLPAGTVFTDSCGRRWESLEGEVLTGVGTAIAVRRVR